MLQRGRIHSSSGIADDQLDMFSGERIRMLCDILII